MRTYYKPHYFGSEVIFIMDYGCERWTVHLFPVVVPDRIFGLTLILDSIDRCTRCALTTYAVRAFLEDFCCQMFCLALFNVFCYHIVKGA